MYERVETGPVVVGVDGSPANEAASRWALAEAARRGVGLIAVHVVTPASSEEPLITPEIEADRRSTVEEATTPAVEITNVFCAGDPAHELAAEAGRQRAQILVVGRRGRGRVARMLIGSVSSALAQNPHLPLVIVPDDSHGRSPEHRPGGVLGHVVVGIDGSAESAVPLRWAAAEASAAGATLEVVLAWSTLHLELLPFAPAPFDNEPALHRFAKEVLDGEIAKLGALGGTAVSRCLRKGDAADVLLQRSADADLLVVGTRGLGAIRQRMLGSTSHAMLQRSAVPLVIVPTEAAAQDGSAAVGAGVGRSEDR